MTFYDLLDKHWDDTCIILFYLSIIVAIIVMARNK